MSTAPPVVLVNGKECCVAWIDAAQRLVVCRDTGRCVLSTNKIGCPGQFCALLAMNDCLVGGTTEGQLVLFHLRGDLHRLVVCPSAVRSLAPHHEGTAVWVLLSDGGLVLAPLPLSAGTAQCDANLRQW